MCVVVLAALLVLSCAPCLTWAAENSAIITLKVRVFQEYRVPVSGLQNTFEYLIEPVEKGAPLPVDEDGNTYDRFTLTREEDMWLVFPVKVTVDPSATPYTYHYMIRPAQEELSDGLYYVDVLSTDLSAGVNEYPLEIHIQPANVNAAASIVTPTVHIDGWDSPKVADPGWRVSYKTAADEQKGAQSSNDGKQSSSDTSSRNPLAKMGDVLACGTIILCLCSMGMTMLMWGNMLRTKAGDSNE